MVTDLSVKHNYADLGDVMLHYVTAGEGPPAAVFCGDLNADDELEGATAVHRLLTTGEVLKLTTQCWSLAQTYRSVRASRMTCACLLRSKKVSVQEALKACICPIRKNEFGDM